MDLWKSTFINPIPMVLPFHIHLTPLMKLFFILLLVRRPDRMKQSSGTLKHSIIKEDAVQGYARDKTISVHKNINILWCNVLSARPCPHAVLILVISWFMYCPTITGGVGVEVVSKIFYLDRIGELL